MPAANRRRNPFICITNSNELPANVTKKWHFYRTSSVKHLTPDCCMKQPRYDSPIKTILLAGLITGLLDITAAIVILGKMNVAGVLKYIASGVLGKAAFQGGTDVALLGLLFHFCIAYSFTILYFIIYPHIVLFQKQKVLSGLLYGILVWCVMNLLVLPLTHVSRGPFKWDKALLNMAILMVMIGLPISLIIHRYYRSRLAAVTA